MKKKDRNKKLKALKKKRAQSRWTNSQTACPAHESPYQLFTKKTPRRWLMPIAELLQEITWIS